MGLVFHRSDPEGCSSIARKRSRGAGSAARGLQGDAKHGLKINTVLIYDCFSVKYNDGVFRVGFIPRWEVGCLINSAGRPCVLRGTHAYTHLTFVDTVCLVKSL